MHACEIAAKLFHLQYVRQLGRRTPQKPADNSSSLHKLSRANYTGFTRLRALTSKVVLVLKYFFVTRLRNASLNSRLRAQSGTIRRRWPGG